jgi:hypothetical protein
MPLPDNPTVSLPKCSKPVIWLLSDGRSGSTWHAQLLDYRGNMRIEHEPVHRSFNPRLGAEPLLPLPGSAPIDEVYVPLFADIIAGQRVAPRFDRPEAPSDGEAAVVIRDIHAMLIAPRLLRALPELRPVVIVRHPAEVAISKLSLPRWEWFSETERFLADAELADCLAGLEAYLLSADTLFRRFIVTWAVIHRYFFAQLPERPIVVPYPAARETVVADIDAILAAAALPVPTAGDVAFERAYNARSASDRTNARHSLRDRLRRRPRPTVEDFAFAEEVIDAFDLRWLVPARMSPAGTRRRA